MPEEKRTVASILIDKFLKDVDEKGSLPWQRPYEVQHPFNWLTMKPYKGYNRLFLPMGEYLTKNQLSQINKQLNQDYKFTKGIKWWSVAYFTKDTKEISESEVLSIFSGDKLSSGMGIHHIGTNGYWNYYYEDGRYYKSRNILRYYDVADIKYFVNSKGETLPSRLSSGELELTFSNAREVFEGYVNNQGIYVNYEYKGVPSYVPSLDTIQLNPYTKSEDGYWSTAFHEAGHSTGARGRLNRVGIINATKKDKEQYAKEECIAEICAGLLCSECKVYSFDTSNSREYENNLAYVNAYKKKIKDWGAEFIYIASQAEKAYDFIIGSYSDDEDTDVE